MFENKIDDWLKDEWLKVPTINVMLEKGAYLPRRAHSSDAGYDLCSPVETLLKKGESAVISTGIHIEIPQGYVGFLKSKSGLNVRHGITGEGVIDSGYTGSITVKLYNQGEDYLIKKGDKIIQLVLLPVFTPELKVVETLENTERGDNGFGSTGR